MKAEVSCLNTKAIFDYLHRHSQDPKPFLRNLCEDLDDVDDPYQYLSDRNNWTSSAVVTRLLGRLREELADEQLPFKIGHESVLYRRFGYVQNILLRLFTSPPQGLKKLQEINDRFNRTKRVELTELAGNKAVVRLHWFGGMELSRDLCLWNQGIYTAIPKVWGMKPGSLMETQCSFEGGEVCEYRMRWQSSARLFAPIKNFFIPRSLFEETVREMEADKTLLTNKYREVRDLSVRLRKKIRELETIHESGKAIVSILDRRELLNVIMRLTTTWLGYDRAMIMLADEEDKTLVLAGSSGASTDEMRKFGAYRVSLSRVSNLLVRTYVSGTPALVDENSRRVLNPENAILRAFAPTSFAVVPLISRGKVIGVMAADRRSAKEAITQEDLDYLSGFGNHVAVALENSRLYQSLEQAYLEAIRSLARALEAKDPYTSGHSERVSRYSERLAIALEIPEQQTRQLTLACLIHDIGKIGVSERVLHKPTALDRMEQGIIRQHPVTGESIIRPLKGLEQVARFIRHHHEHYDGTGYPDRLAGDAIPLESRIMAIADCYDAMTTKRPYREPLPEEAVCRELTEFSGTQFDPSLVEVFLRLVEGGSLRCTAGKHQWPQEA